MVSFYWARKFKMYHIVLWNKTFNTNNKKYIFECKHACVGGLWMKLNEGCEYDWL